MITNIPRIVARLTLFLSLLLTPALAAAVGLQCKVVEVSSGDTLSVINGSGPMKVRLKAVDAPEMDQPWGDTARQHLADLALGKVVMVKLNGLSAEKSIIGVVYLGQTDIGQQMIRDGVAWYDKSGDNGLSELERRLYLESEQAARSERRGIWQDDQPLPPWEFRQAKSRQAAAGTTAQNSLPKTTGGTISGARQKAVPRPDTSNWQRFAPEGEAFSILLPPVPVESQKERDTEVLSHYRVRSEGLIYEVLKCKNPEGESPEVIFNNFTFFQDFFHRASREHGISADIYPQRDLPPLNGYAGKQYEIFVNSLHGMANIYISRRYIYIVSVAGGYEGDPRVDQFLASFKIGDRINGSTASRKSVK
jgi:endonuclease YncB( thermonuclease family)